MSRLPEISRSRSSAAYGVQPESGHRRRRKTRQAGGPASADRLAPIDILARTERMIRAMPADYLRSKAELRRYLLERACEQLVQPFQRRYTAILTRAFQTWRSPPVVQLNEKQFGMLLICKVVLNSFDRRARLAFFHWAYLFSNRYNPRPLDAITLAVITIQRWYRYHRSKLKKVLQTWDMAVKVSLQRHRVSTRFFLFEKMRHQALQKLRMGIAFRRRFFFACRTIQRVWRWVRKCRRVSRRLRRVYHARLIQRWWSRLRVKGRPFWDVIHVIMSAG